MFTRFIVATDLSPASFTVVRCLEGLKAYGARQCLLLQCLVLSEAPATAVSSKKTPVEAMLAEQKNILEQQGYTVVTRTVVGIPKHEIVRIAAKEEYSLIVVGSQGQSMVKEKILGGVAYGVLNKSVQPVLVIPVQKKQGLENECEPMARCRFNDHILFATDFSAAADNAFNFVKHFVAQGAGKATLVHVQDKTKLEQYLMARLEMFNQQDRGRLEKLQQDLLTMGTPAVDLEICYGVPYQEITRIIEERDVQLVAMGTQGRGFAGEFFLGSVSLNVVRHSSAPVLLIPPVARTETLQ
jgi:nucleotide-binding universal stress UspA family protein